MGRRYRRGRRGGGLGRRTTLGGELGGGGGLEKEMGGAREERGVGRGGYEGGEKGGGTFAAPAMAPMRASWPAASRSAVAALVSRRMLRSGGEVDGVSSLELVLRAGGRC